MHRTRFQPATFLFLFLLLFTASALFAADNWPQWRGPFMNGSNTTSDLPATWDDTTNVKWVTRMPGKSGATPIVWNDRIFASSVDEKTDALLAMCLRTTDGRILWQKDVGKNSYLPRNTMATPSPVTDGKTVFFTYGTGRLIAFDFSGKKLWSRNLVDDYGPFSIQFGYSSTPLLYKDKLYIQVLQNDNPRRYRHLGIKKTGKLESYLLAVDPKTGKDIWRRIRLSNARDESLEAYSSPIPFTHNGREELLVFGADCLTGHDPETGKEIWRWEGFNERDNPRWRVVPSPLPGKGLIYVSAPKHDPFYAVKAGATGTVGMEQVAWKLERDSPDAAMPLLYRGRLYVLNDDRRILSCLDPETGNRIWQERLDARAVFRAGLTGADGKVYAMNEAGEVFVFQAGDTFKLLHKRRMGRQPSRAAIVAARGCLFIRTNDSLTCLKKEQ